MRTTPQEPQSSLAPETPANLRYDKISIREQKAIDTLINMGLLLEKKLKKEGLVVKYYDAKGEVLLLKRVTTWGAIQYEAYKIASSEFSDDLNYEQLPKLFIATTTKDRINIEHYIPGAWETRINKLAEGKINGKDEPIPTIKKAPRVTGRKSKR